MPNDNEHKHDDNLNDPAAGHHQQHDPRPHYHVDDCSIFDGELEYHICTDDHCTDNDAVVVLSRDEYRALHDDATSWRRIQQYGLTAERATTPSNLPQR